VPPIQKPVSDFESSPQPIINRRQSRQQSYNVGKICEKSCRLLKIKKDFDIVVGAKGRKMFQKVNLLINAKPSAYIFSLLELETSRFSSNE
jgi:hypothetical protein